MIGQKFEKPSSNFPWYQPQLSEYDKKLREESKRCKIKEDIRSCEWSNNLSEQQYPKKLEVYVDDYLTCGICCQIFENPYEFSCRHFFCRECVIQHDNHTKKETYLRCPHCKEKQSRQLSDEQSEDLKNLKYFLGELPIVCIRCTKPNVSVPVHNFEESKNVQATVFSQVIKLKNFEDHIYYVHSDIIDSQINESCSGSIYGCVKTFNSLKDKHQHEGQCSFQWRRCLKCLNLHFGENYNKHVCKNIDLSETLQIEFKQKTKKSFTVLVIFDCEQKVDKDLQWLQISQMFLDFQRHFHFEVDPTHQHQVSRLIIFHNMFIAENFIDSVNTMKQHPTLKVNALKFDESFVVEPQKQIEKHALFDPDYKIENDELSVFFSAAFNCHIIKQTCALYGPVKSHKIFGKNKKSNKYFGIIEFHNQDQVTTILSNADYRGWVRIGDKKINIRQYERR